MFRNSQLFGTKNHAIGKVSAVITSSQLEQKLRKHGNAFGGYPRYGPRYDPYGNIYNP